jgi:hypothetical protein
LGVSLSLTFVETVHMGVAVSGESVSVGGTAVPKAIIGPGVIRTISVGMMSITIIPSIQVSWVGFRLSQSKGGKGENYDQELHGYILV